MSKSDTLYRLTREPTVDEWATFLDLLAEPLPPGQPVLEMVEVESAESVKIRWCRNHRRETWGGRTTCVGLGATDMCDVVDARLIIKEDT